MERGLDVEIDIPETSGAHHIEHRHVPAWVPWLVLAAIVTTYINIGAYWTYIELASLASDATPDWVARLLVWSSFCSLVGCLFATIVSNRFGLARPLLVTLVCQSVIVGMLAGGINDANIVVSMFAFNFLWIFVDVYQMSTVANVDRSGRLASLMPGAQGLGQILGPNIGIDPGRGLRLRRRFRHVRHRFANRDVDLSLHVPAPAETDTRAGGCVIMYIRMHSWLSAHDRGGRGESPT